MAPTAALAPVRKHFAKTIDRLALHVLTWFG